MRLFWNPREGRLRAGWRLVIQLSCNLGLAILAMLVYETVNVLLLLWWARWRRGAGGRSGSSAGRAGENPRGVSP